MQTIILKDFECSHVLEHIKYPDGQRSLCLNLNELDVKELVNIKCRITKFESLEYLLCLVSALRKNDFHIHSLSFLYLFGMRSDRSFKVGEPNYFRDVVASIINNLNIDRIYLECPHSDISAACIIGGKTGSRYWCDENIPDGYVIIKGDQHARFKALSYFQKIRIDKDNIEVNLDENSISAISKGLSCHGKAIIVDDLCDAGGTFIADAKCFRKYFPDYQLDLYVTHGLFTKGLEPLLEHFNHIYCTNSYQDIVHPRVTQMKVI